MNTTQHDIKIKKVSITCGANNDAQTMGFCSVEDKKNVPCFGCNGVIAYAPNDSISGLWYEDSSKVTAVKGKEDLLIAGYANGLLRVWKRGKCIQVLSDHTSSIRCLSVIFTPSLIISGSSLGEICIYIIESSGLLKLSTKLNLNHLSPLSISSAALKNSEHFIIAIGGCSKQVEIWEYCMHDERARLIQILDTFSEWVRSVDLVSREGHLLLVCGSNDKTIRLWKFLEKENDVASFSEKQEHTFPNCITNIDCIPTSILTEHDDWVTSVQWHPTGSLFISCSADSTIIIWKFDPVVCTWGCVSRIGETLNMKGSTSATGSAGGFWQVMWDTNCQKIYCLTRNGSIRIWNFTEADIWAEIPGISGHLEAITCLSWSKLGNYLLTGSLDMTTRLWGQIKDDGIIRELSRPQVHGYSINSICALSNDRFASGGDEKVVRLFGMPASVLRILVKAVGDSQFYSQFESASMPLLGLSNKSQTEEENKLIEWNCEYPNESQLQRYTLWPEIEKLYGHGFEIASVACTTNGKLLVSACKATTEKHAAFRVYETNTWTEVQCIPAHHLTIQKMCFSSNDLYLLTVSRDRSFSIFIREITGYSLLENHLKAHAKVIKTCCWLLDGERPVFVTGSRDKYCKVWAIESSIASCIQTFKFDSGVSALDSYVLNDICYLAIGLENGDIHLSQIPKPSISLKKLNAEFSCIYRLSVPVSDLRWKPGNCCSLAIAAEDGQLHVIDF